MIIYPKFEVLFTNKRLIYKCKLREAARTSQKCILYLMNLKLQIINNAIYYINLSCRIINSTKPIHF